MQALFSPVTIEVLGAAKSWFAAFMVIQFLLG
jgi:hypothetical protein